MIVEWKTAQESGEQLKEVLDIAEKQYLESLKPRALTMYRHSSHNPQFMGENHFNWRENQLQELIKVVPEEFKSDVIRRFKNHYIHEISSIARVASPFVTGGSNFPTHRMEKYRRWEQSSSDKMTFFIENTIKRFTRKEKLGLNEEYERLKDEVSDAEAYHEMMVACNAFLKKNKNATKEEKTEEFENMGFTEKQIQSIFDTRYTLEGFMPYELTNSRARIKGKKETLKKYEERVNDIGEEKPILFESDDLKVIKNVEKDRYQFFFDGKPDRDIIDCLKRNGFRWTPTEGCWQCYLTIHSYKLNEVKSLLIKKGLWNSEN